LGHSLVFFGLLMYGVARLGNQSNWDDFGAWRSPPRWAQLLFGTFRGSIPPYRLGAELWGFSCIVPGLLIWLTSDLPRLESVVLILIPFLGATAFVLWSFYVALWPEIGPWLERRRARR
jgi:hypothetical protein